MEDQTFYSEMMESCARKASEELCRSFEAIAKLAMQAAARSRDQSVHVAEKVRQAHSDLTLITEEAMRGFSRALHEAMAFAMYVGLKVDEKRRKSD